MQANCKRIVEPCNLATRGSEYTLRQMSIAPGPMGTMETLRIMAVLAKDALTYLDFCTFMSDIICNGAVLTLHPNDIDIYLRGIYRYVNEDVETLYSPAYNAWHFRQNGYIMGDCDDICMMYAAVFHALGYRSKFVAMRTKPRDLNFYHVVIETFVEGRWLRFDATVPRGTIHTDYGLMEVTV